MNIISVNAELSTLVEAGSDITAWLEIALTELAPCPNIMSDAFVIVPAVSTISSINNTSIPFTSPMICISDISFAFLRSL